MKKLTTIVVTALLFASCHTTDAEKDPATPENRVVVKNISFTIDTVYFAAGSVNASGTLKNIGTQSVAPLFYVSGQFYKRNTYVTSLGESRSIISQGVKIGEVVPWTLSKPVVGDTAQFTQPALAKMQIYYVE